MGEFFKGWRRKAGLVTLVMACLLTVGWMRSIAEFDCFCLTGNSWLHVSWFNVTIQSAEGRLTLFRDSPDYGIAALWWSGENAKTIEPYDPLGVAEGIHIEWRRDWACFTFGAYHVLEGTELIRTDVYDIPYWSLVLPLTLLSAWLILIKPRKAKGSP